MVPPKPNKPAMSKQKSTSAMSKSSSKPTPPPVSKSSSKGVTKVPAKTKRSKKTKRGTLADMVLLLGLLFFSSYAIVTCPSDVHLQNPVCKSLSLYRDSVVEPYVMPTVRKVMAHPTVKKVEGVVAPAYQKVVVPAYQKVVAPAYQNVALPAYTRIVRPVYEKKVLPFYRSSVWPRIQPYVAKAQPYIRRGYLYYYAAFDRVESAYIACQPYLDKVYVQIETVKPHVIQAYHAALPHAQAAWAQALVLCKAGLKQAAEARKAYVDPHVGKMWAKVMEGGKATRTDKAPAPEPVTSMEEVVPEVSSTAEETFASTLSETPSSTLEEIVTEMPVATSLEATPSSVESAPSASVEETPSASAEETLEPTPSETSSEAPQTTPSSTSSEAEPAPTKFEAPSFISDELAEELAISADAARAAAAAESATASSAEPVHTEAPAPIPEDTPDAFDDIDDFLASLGLASSSTAEPEPTSTPAAPKPLPDSPEEKERIAKKRAAILERHAKHYEELTTLADDLFLKLRMALMQVRSRATAVMFGQAQDEREWDFVDGKHIAREAGSDGVRDECDGLVDGLERYLNREIGRGSGGDDIDARKTKWETVLGRVEEKWRHVTSVAQGRVVDWVRGVREEEFKECISASEQVKARAEKAQANLGLDYAWLEDVTYNDWQEYHKLMGVYEDFREQVQLLQENKHPRPVGDPLMMALPRMEEGMKNEVGECVRRMRVLNKRADNLFSGRPTGGEDKLVGTKYEKKVQKIGKFDEGKTVVDGLLGKAKGEAPLKADDQAFVGRIKEEVEAKLKDIPLEGSATASTPEVSILPVSGTQPEPQVSILPISEVDESQAPEVSILPVGTPEVHIREEL